VCLCPPSLCAHNDNIKQGYFEDNESLVFDRDGTHLSALVLSDITPGKRVVARFWMHCGRVRGGEQAVTSAIISCIIFVD